MAALLGRGQEAVSQDENGTTRVVPKATKGAAVASRRVMLGDISNKLTVPVGKRSVMGTKGVSVLPPSSSTSTSTLHQPKASGAIRPPTLGAGRVPLRPSNRSFLPPAPVAASRPLRPPAPRSFLEEPDHSINARFQKLNCGGSKKEESAAVLPSWRDIDTPVQNDPQAVSEFAEDIMRHLWAVESKYHPSSDFLGNIQEHINEKMRGILVDWLVQVHYKFNLLSETLFLATNFMDRFLEKIPVSRSKLQLVGMVALLVACKYEEIYLPEVNDFVYICDHAYTKDEILQMEGVMLNTLQFSLTVATPAYFLARFCKAADCSSKVKMYATYVCELCLQEYSMRTYRPSTLCAAALYTALLVNNSKDEVNWNATLQHYTNYTDAELHACVQDMKTLLKKGPTYPSLTAVRRKYASSRYEAVATIELPF